MLVEEIELQVEIEQVGRLLFGRETRLLTALWVHTLKKPRFYQSEPPPACGVPTAVRQELSRLVALGMLSEERPDGENRVYYLRTDSPLWKIIEVVRDVVMTDPSHRDAADSLVDDNRNASS